MAESEKLHAVKELPQTVSRVESLEIQLATALCQSLNSEANSLVAQHTLVRARLEAAQKEFEATKARVWAAYGLVEGDTFNATTGQITRKK